MKKPVKKTSKGYTKSERDSLRTLIERTQPDAGDYVGSGTVTTKKPAKKMASGGVVSKGMKMRGCGAAKRGIKTSSKMG